MLKTVREKIAYLRGMLDGDPSLKEGNHAFLLGEILEVLTDLAREVNELAQGQEELSDYVEEVDFDLAYMEDEFFADDVADDHFGWHDHGEDWEEHFDDSLVEIQCPDCDDIVTFSEDFLFDESVQIRCPRCDAVVFETDDFEDVEDLFNEDAVENVEDVED